jgi:hypothetical protein
VCRAQTPDVGEEELPRIADDHVLDLAAPVNQHADLPAGLSGRVAQRLRQFSRGDLGDRYAAAVDALEDARR